MFIKYVKTKRKETMVLQVRKIKGTANVYIFPLVRHRRISLIVKITNLSLHEETIQHKQRLSKQRAKPKAIVKQTHNCVSQFRVHNIIDGKMC